MRPALPGRHEDHRAAQPPRGGERAEGEELHRERASDIVERSGEPSDELAVHGDGGATPERMDSQKDRHQRHQERDRGRTPRETASHEATDQGTGQAGELYADARPDRLEREPLPWLALARAELVEREHQNGRRPEDGAREGNPG